MNARDRPEEVVATTAPGEEDMIELASARHKRAASGQKGPDDEAFTEHRRSA